MRTLRDEVAELFGAVSGAIGDASRALLDADVALAETVIAADRAIDRRAATVEAEVWRLVDEPGRGHEPRELVSLLRAVAELERSADLAEHIASRARSGLGSQLGPVARGVVTRMGEVALEMWQSAATAYRHEVGPTGSDLDEADEELDILHDRLTAEIAAGGMDPGAAAQATLVARFYERLGDHAVNLARRAETMVGSGPPREATPDRDGG